MKKMTAGRPDVQYSSVTSPRAKTTISIVVSESRHSIFTCQRLALQAHALANTFQVVVSSPRQCLASVTLAVPAYSIFTPSHPREQTTGCILSNRLPLSLQSVRLGETHPSNHLSKMAGPAHESPRHRSEERRYSETLTGGAMVGEGCRKGGVIG